MRPRYPLAALALAAAASAALAAAGPLGLKAAADGGRQLAVDIPGRSYAPETLVALVGDTVTWTNDDHIAHTVTGDDFDSGRLDHGARFSLTLTTPGMHHYRCTIHRDMHGMIDVYGVALIGPPGPLPLGSRLRLTGLAPAGVASVALERRGPDGVYQPVATAAVAADGSFAFPVTASAPSSYRARAGDQLSPAVAVRPRARISLSLRRAGGRLRAVVRAGPGQAGAPVRLEQYLPERYWWRPVAAARIARGGRALMAIPAPPGRTRLRAHLLRGRGGWGEAVSRPAAVG